jgi:hypothetical protein
MNEHIDFILFENAKIHSAHYWDRVSKKYILELSGDHRASPSIGQGTSGSGDQDVSIILVHAHMGSMHQLHNLTVNSSGSYPHVSPYLLSFKRSSLHKEEFSFLTSELSQRLVPYINGDLID